MTINNMIRDEKLEYGINREVAKISAFSSGKIDKYMNILQVKIYYVLIKEVQYDKLSLFILLQEKLWKNKQNQLKIKEENK